MNKKFRYINKWTAILLACVMAMGMCCTGVYADSQTEPAAQESIVTQESAGADAAATEAAPAADAAAAETAPDAAAQETAAAPAADPSAEPVLSAEKAVLIEAETGNVLFGKDPETAASPASMTKIMTGYLGVLNGDLAQNVTMTEAGVSMAYSGSANLYTQVGEVFTLEQLLYGALVYSANDMATQIAEVIGGSVDGFLAMMNEKAAQLGCTNTHFATACGYPDDNNTASAHDIARILNAAVENETFRTIIGTTQYVIPQTNLTDHDRVFDTRILLKSDPAYAYEGVIGGKTGFTDIAGCCLAAACERDGMRLIAVVMHAPDAQQAAADVIKLFDYGYNNYEKTQLTHPDFPDYTGTAVLKKGSTPESLTVTENLDETAEEGPQHIFEYYDGEQKVGSVKVPEEVYQAFLDAQIESVPEEPEEPEVTETPEPTPAPVIEERKRVEFPTNFSELMVWLNDGANRLLFILVILIILSLILAFVLWIKQLGRRIRKRRRKRQLRKKKKEMNRR